MSAKPGILEAKWAIRFLSQTLLRLGAEKGATATEYSLLVGLIALVIVGGVGLFGGALNGFFDTLSTTVGAW
ncbi:Flp family type IVb pilin [Arthrobacter sp. KN11-1C]|uniref:Flp family type IVb pilin n=1 Tax=Arthrobacter sp. KN11-1C TaxID=3445774 RepID=UPI003F9EED35